MVENDVDIVKTAFVAGFNKEISYSQNLGRVVVPSDNITPLMTYNYLEAWSTLYRKEFLISNNLKFSYKYKIHENFLFSVQALSKTNKDIILLDDVEGYFWNLKQDGAHDKHVPFEEFGNVIECSSKMISTLVQNNQPVEAIQELFPFVLSICGSGIYNSDTTMEQKADYFLRSVFHAERIADIIEDKRGERNVQL